MSVENGKVCCNCRHCLRIWEEYKTYCHEYCEVKKIYMGYVQVMEGWCRHWAKDREETQNERHD